jgi:hypothetical protein
MSALYHLNRAIDLYVENVRQYEKTAPANALRGSISDPRTYWEADAFIGVARRIYEAISKVLWKH